MMAVSSEHVAISRWARAFIRDQGGSVYVWTEPAGEHHVTLAASHSRPPDVVFELCNKRDDGVKLFLQEDLATTPLGIRLRRLPHKKLVAFAGFFLRDGMGGFGV